MQIPVQCNPCPKFSKNLRKFLSPLLFNMVSEYVTTKITDKGKGLELNGTRPPPLCADLNLLQININTTKINKTLSTLFNLEVYIARWT
jgi:hypothetical protein